MRVKNIISKVKIKLKEFDYQKASNFYTDEEILSFVNDAQNDIIIRYYTVEGIENFNIANNVDFVNLPDYIGEIKKVIDNKDNVYEFVTPSKFLEKSFCCPSFTLLNNVLRVHPAPSQSGAGTIIIYFKYSKVKTPANLNNTDLTVPNFYDKAVEYYVLHQLLIGEPSIFYKNLYEDELLKRAGIYYTRAKDNKIIGSW